VATSVGLATSLTNPFLALFITQRIKVGASGLAVFIFLSAAAALVLCTFLGWLSDRQPIRRALLVSGGACGCGAYGLFAVLRIYWLLLIASMSLAALASSLIPQVFACARLALDQGSSRRAPLGVAALRMLFAVSWVAGPPLGAVLIRLAGYTGLFAVVACAYGVAALVAVPSLGSLAEPELSRDESRQRSARPRIALAGAAFIALQTANALGVLALPLLLTRSLGAGTGSVGLIFGFAAALEIPLMLAFGVLATRIAKRWLVLMGAVAGAAYYAVIASSGVVWEVVAAQFLGAVFVAATMAVGISFFQELVPGRAGFATSMYSNTSKVSSMLAGPLIGLAQQFGYRAVFVAGAVLCGAGAVLLAATGSGPEAPA
jgi:SET family sugar efflux transporter-like MFS transporter